MDYYYKMMNSSNEELETAIKKLQENIDNWPHGMTGADHLVRWRTSYQNELAKRSLEIGNKIKWKHLNGYSIPFKWTDCVGKIADMKNDKALVKGFIINKNIKVEEWLPYYFLQKIV